MHGGRIFDTSGPGGCLASRPETGGCSQNGGSLHPTLRWKPILGTVYYNVSVTLPNGTALPDDRTYVAGYNLSLPAGTRGDVSVKIQSFNLDEKPVSALSPVE